MHTQAHYNIRARRRCIAMLAWLTYRSVHAAILASPVVAHLFIRRFRHCDRIADMLCTRRHAHRGAASRAMSAVSCGDRQPHRLPLHASIRELFVLVRFCVGRGVMSMSLFFSQTHSLLADGGPVAFVL